MGGKGGAQAKAGRAYVSPPAKGETQQEQIQRRLTKKPEAERDEGIARKGREGKARAGGRAQGRASHSRERVIEAAAAHAFTSLAPPRRAPLENPPPPAALTLIRLERAGKPGRAVGVSTT